MRANRAATVGFILAALQLQVTLIMALLALIVWQQGLPQDYDTTETMSTEALALGRLAAYGALPLLASFVVSIVLLVRGRRAQVVATLAWIMLLASAILGLIGYRTWGGFGW